ncbi:CHAT domain-containing protein [Lentzea sp. CA-135723]|uniref:CHAT domain-containing protein n=1 Tax=Lentzea sp. CA-135723 TaxID=3239950 RepID=UPI003D8F5950
MAHDSPTDPVARRIALVHELDRLLAEASELVGREGLLGSQKISDLVTAAERGPVAIVNTSRWRCDALLLTLEGVSTIELPALSLWEATQRADRYLSVLRAAEAADVAYVRAQAVVAGEKSRVVARRVLVAGTVLERAHQRVDELLQDLQEWMWNAFAGPIVEALGFTTTPDDGTAWQRMWWCATGPLAVLPVHTAGYHDRLHEASPRTVMDRVISSYTPSVRALLEARRPHGRLVDDDGDFDRLLFVDVPDLPDEVPIDNTAERAALFAAFPADRRKVLGSNEATPEAVLAALPHHRWVHFSCHGDQDLADPVRGGLLLRGGMLTVEALVSGRFRGDFAGLSACKTAVGGVVLLDEAITLASALHHTGYRHVIAALWSVDNKASAEVFGQVYRTIAADGRLSPDDAPAALHGVIRTMRDSAAGWPHLWSPFTHTGP